jgi:hypothetical protein
LRGVSVAAPKPEFPIVVAEWDRNSREVVHLTRVEMNPAPCARLSACAALGGVVDTFEHR